MPLKERMVSSIKDFVRLVYEDHEAWNTKAAPWFRGEPGRTQWPLTPTLYRVKSGAHYDENQLLQSFRQRAPVLDLPVLPQREHIDQWLFLARHVRLPTRLLDWTEGALIALYFAILEGEDTQPAVWMLNPFALFEKNQVANAIPDIYPLTWFHKTRTVIRNEEIQTEVVEANVGLLNVQDAWTGGSGKNATEYPVPVYPTFIHPRMAAQLSCFTISGRRKGSLVTMMEEDEDWLCRYSIDMDRQSTLNALRIMGVSYANLLPEADGLAKDLEHRYPPG
jgi:hypothetical protein